MQSQDQISIEQARELGESGMLMAQQRAERQEPGFTERAKAFVLQYLRLHGDCSGEDITDACKAAGITPEEDRAFGPVYSSLSRNKQIEFAGYCDRRKGHGTAGGRIWRLART